MIEFTEEIYKKYDHMIYKIAKGYLSQNRDLMWRITLDDLHSEGLLALANACEKFDPEIGNQFSTYAWYAIDNQLKAYIRTNMRSFSITQNTNRYVSQIHSLQKQGKTPEEIAMELNVSIPEILEIQNINSCSYSLDYDIEAKDNSELKFYDMLSTETIDDINQKKLEENLRDIIDGITSLTKEEKVMYCEYMGILGYPKKTKKELKDESSMNSRDFDKMFDKTVRVVRRNIQLKYDQYN